MKSLVYAAVVASVLAAPVASFAQSNQPVTRAEVHAQLVQLEQAGYNPVASDAQYPRDIQAAEARVQQSQQTLTHADTSGYGVQPVAGAQSGRRNDTAPNPVDSVYFGH
ncbi:DUF4148 domain-containing protein [Burkholderia gladioli]|uniref:DUF4148 domain-containing protein n=1 Tax=Burkholderia gladioli TaxID=28095 RepID=UPI0016415E44|nr:DUF4148 domain-containing protein [Burkholderia gladioli]